MRQHTLRRVNQILIVFALISMLLTALITSATPTYNLSLVYSECNSAEWTEKDVPSGNYTAPYSITITPNIVWNETTANPQVTIHFRNVSNEINGELFGVKLYETGSLQLLYGNTTSVVVVGSSTYTLGTEIKVSVMLDGFKVHNGTAIVIEYYDAPHDINGFHASGVVFATESGSILFEFSDGGEYGIDILVSFMPLLVTLAVLGMVMKSFDRLGSRK